MRYAERTFKAIAPEFDPVLEKAGNLAREVDALVSRVNKARTSIAKEDLRPFTESHEGMLTWRLALQFKAWGLPVKMTPEEKFDQTLRICLRGAGLGVEYTLRYLDKLRKSEAWLQGMG